MSSVGSCSCIATGDCSAHIARTVDGLGTEWHRTPVHQIAAQWTSTFSGPPAIASGFLAAESVGEEA